MRFLIVLALVPACYLQGRGQFSNSYGGGGGGVGFMIGDDRQDGELGLEVASSRTPARAGEPGAPTMMMLGARYAHAIDRDGIWRLYGRASIGGELCPTTKEAQMADECLPTPADSQPLGVSHSVIEEVGAGVALAVAAREADRTGAEEWETVWLSLGVVYSAMNTRERGSDDFTGIDLALTVGFDPLRELDEHH